MADESSSVSLPSTPGTSRSSTPSTSEPGTPGTPNTPLAASTASTPPARRLPVTSENWAETMEIPWSQMPAAVDKALKTNKRLADEKARRKMVQIIVDAMRMNHSNPTKAHATVVAKRIVRHNPECFEDRTLGGVKLGLGIASWVTSMCNRIGYVTRGDDQSRLRKPRAQKRLNATEDAGPDGKPSDAYGCISWQPDFPENETEESLESMRLELVNLHHSHGPKTSSQVDELMEKTYFLQRRVINNGQSIQETKEAWPFLFYQRWVCLHFRLLTGKAAYTQLMESFQERGKLVMKYFQNLMLSGKAKQNVKSVLTEMTDTTQQTGEAVDNSAAVMLLIMAQLGETTDSLILLVDVSIINILFL